jgi:hypothetical protein
MDSLWQVYEINLLFILIIKVSIVFLFKRKLDIYFLINDFTRLGFIYFSVENHVNPDNIMN